MIHKWGKKVGLMRLWHEDLDDAVSTALRRLFLFKYKTDSVKYLQRLLELFNLLNFDSSIESRMSVEVVLTSSRVVQWQIIDVSMMRCLRSRIGCFDPVLE